MVQSDAYKFVNEVNRLADQVGADQARDVLKVLVSRQDLALDVSAETVPTAPESNASASGVGTTIPSDGETDETLKAEGAERVVGRINRKEAYTVTVEWQNKQRETLFTDTVTSDQTGTYELDEKAIAPTATVTIQDAASAENDATYTLHMR